MNDQVSLSQMSTFEAANKCYIFFGTLWNDSSGTTMSYLFSSSISKPCAQRLGYCLKVIIVICSNMLQYP